MSRRRQVGAHTMIGVLIASVLITVLGAETGSAQERIAVVTEPGTPVVAMQVLVATGPEHEPEGREGVSYLAARAIADPLTPALNALGARLDVTIDKHAIGFSLIAAPDAWETASRALLLALFRDPPLEGAVLRQRQAVQAELRARAANPADAAKREADAAFFGPSHPWGRSTVGTISSIGSLSLDDVDLFLRQHFVPERTVIVVLGPVDETAVRGHLRPLTGNGPLQIPEVEARDPVRSAVQREYDTITTWISIVYPLPQQVDEEATRMLAHLIANRFQFGPTQQSIFDAQAEVIGRRRGGELRLEVVVPPAEASVWAKRVQEEVQQMARTTMPAQDFERELRRFRGTRLLALSLPEARAMEAAQRLLRGRPRSELLPAPGALTPERLRAAANALGDPSVVFLGAFFVN